uniref:Uncharacterized protein n=1 Tax=Arundo donax TaxID=35708 RepID=A0A0A9AGD1_ARUDO
MQPPPPKIARRCPGPALRGRDLVAPVRIRPVPLRSGHSRHLGLPPSLGAAPSSLHHRRL